jgi:hypothetical protein
VGKIPVLNITSASWQDVVLLTSRVYGVEVWYDGLRTQPITDQQRENPDTYQSLTGKRWQGWCAVRPYHAPTIYLLAVTAVTVQCVPQLDDASYDLRGWTIGLAREANDKRARLKGRWNDRRADLLKLPTPPDVVDALERMWRAPLKRRGVPSPIASQDPLRVARRIVADVADELTIPTSPAPNTKGGR